MTKLLKTILNIVFSKYYEMFDKNNILILILDKNKNIDLEIDLKKRFDFYFESELINFTIIYVNKFSFWKYFFYPNIKLIFGFNVTNDKINYLKNSFLIFDVDYNTNPNDGWEWHFALMKLTYKNNNKLKLETRKSLDNFKNYIDKLSKFEKSYIIGTGPSLSNATNIDWSNGYRIVCNTIVKDPIMWNHINPHIIVAGDAIYHFAFNEFSLSFINDLEMRLDESEAIFMYPIHFHPYVCRKFPKYKNRLIPIPLVERTEVHNNLFLDFRIPSNIGNVLNLLLLPIGCSLSMEVNLYGFDGRAPQDKLFWSNSNSHSYTDKITDIIKYHPMFFNHMVPKNNESNYVNNVHGARLEEILSIAENKGWKFNMMHKSWTPVLNKRFLK